MPQSTCDLCGLSLRFGVVENNTGGTTYRFCCSGCKQVFAMLMAASDVERPADFKHSELFLKCREMGIIPRSEADLIKPGDTGETTASPDPINPTPFTGDGLDATYRVSGMWCPACAWVIDQALLKIPGIKEARCNFSTDRLYCRFDPLSASPAMIRDTVENLGYQALEPQEAAQRSTHHKEWLHFGISAFLTMNVMMLSFALYTGFFSAFSQDTVTKLSWPIFLMATVVLVYGGRSIFRRAWSGLVQSASSMETLIAAGSGSAYLYSTYNLLRGDIHLYFDTAAMLITLVLLGKLLERRAKDRVQETLENLFALQPTKVNLISPLYPDGRYVAIGQLGTGDLFGVAETEVVPADGIVTEGRGTVDESSLTGEAMPVRRKPGDMIRSGTIIVEGGFTIRAVAVGEASTLGQMIAIIDASLNRKTRFESRTDRILQWFVPLILSLAVATGIIAYWLGATLETAIIRAVTVMVISCPCALGVAIPLARTAAFSVASRIGLLIRDFESFEKIKHIDTFVFDKTGTVTEGRWQLLEVVVDESMPETKALGIAAALEQHSDHYIAHAIRRYAAQKTPEPAALTRIETHENGISGLIEGAVAKIGSVGFVADGLPQTAAAGLLAKATDASDKSSVYLTLDGRLAAVFFFGDKLRPTTVSTFDALKQKGLRLFLVSGDGDAATRHVGKRIGVDDAHGNQMPQQKAALVNDWRLKHHYRVAMVGDGINDAPALSAADLALAVYAGSHLGREVADVTLMRGQPDQILDFLELALRTNRKVHQNFVCAFAYNLVSIPLAMSGLLTPLVAVFAMLLSSLSVTGNSLLLIRQYRQNAGEH